MTRLRAFFKYGLLIFIAAALAIIFVSLPVSCTGNGDYGSSLPKNTIMDIGSEGCSPCRQLKPILAELEEDYGDKVDFIFYEAWYSEEGAAMAEKFGVTAVPCVIFLNTDGKEVKRLTGLRDYKTYEDVLISLGWIE